MIYISNEQNNLFELEHEFSTKSLTLVYSDEIKKNINVKIREVVRSGTFALFKERVYVFLDCYVLTNNNIKYLFDQCSSEDFKQKDIYLLALNQKSIKYIRDNFKNKYKYYRYNNSKDKNTFYNDIYKIVSLTDNRSDIINFDEIDITIEYILRVLSYNCINNENNIEQILTNTELLIQMGKYLHVTSKETIQMLISNVFKPIRTFKVLFPPSNKKKVVKEKKIVEIKEKDLHKYVSVDFVDKFKEGSTNIQITKQRRLW